MSEKWASRFSVIKKVIEIEDMSLKHRIIVKFFVKQSTPNKEIRQQLLTVYSTKTKQGKYSDSPRHKKSGMLKAKGKEIMVVFFHSQGIDMVE